MNPHNPSFPSSMILRVLILCSLCFAFFIRSEENIPEFIYLFLVQSTYNLPGWTLDNEWQTHHPLGMWGGGDTVFADCYQHWEHLYSIFKTKLFLFSPPSVKIPFLQKRIEKKWSNFVLLHCKLSHILPNEKGQNSFPPLFLNSGVGSIYEFPTNAIVDCVHVNCGSKWEKERKKMCRTCIVHMGDVCVQLYVRRRIRCMHVCTFTWIYVCTITNIALTVKCLLILR